MRARLACPSHFCCERETYGDSQTKIFITSEVPIADIFAADSDAKSGEISDHMRSMMDDLVCRSSFRLYLPFTLRQGLPGDMVISSSIFSGDEELFAFARCCSRLVQMGSKEWAETAGTS